MEASELKRAVSEHPVRVGRYVVTALIGEGGMGDVYDALDAELGSRVALKTLRDCDLAPERLLLFKNEFRAVTDLDHPNLVPLYELSYHEGLWFFTMERVDGVGLLEGARSSSASRQSSIRTRAGTTLSPFPTHAAVPAAKAQNGAEIESGLVAVGDAQTPGGEPTCDLEFFARAIGQVLDALEYLHQHGIIHQDLKPSNILVDKAGAARVLDFGLAERVGGSVRLRTDKPSGTPPYMAPELWAGGSATPESDLYALGCTMFELLTGTLPATDSWGE